MDKLHLSTDLSTKTGHSVDKPGKSTDLSTKTGHLVEKVGKSGYCAMKR